jgi:chorismate mutase
LPSWDTPGTDPDADPTVTELREQIRQADRALLAAMNERIRLVARVKQHKSSRGIDFIDQAQEERVVASLERENPGPLSPEGLRELYQVVLDLTKREVP